MENPEHLDPEVDIEEEEDHGIALPGMQRTISYGRPRKSCHVTVDLCLRFIHEAMRKNQWERAADLLTSYLQTLESRNPDRQTQAPEIIWRLGSEILLNHPKSTNGGINVFHEYMKNIGIKKYLSVSLEQAFHIMCYGELNEAHRVLSLAESWRCGQHSIKQNKLQKLIQAYKAILNYRTWVDKRSALTQNGLGYTSQSSAAQAMDSYYRQATVILQDIIQSPGVWDPFVLSYVDLLESSEKKEEAEKVLQEYAYNTKNPVNPNALVYLYEFMKKNGAVDEMLIKVLKDLHAMTPSHKLMLTFHKLLDHSDSEANQMLALQVLFDLLDFSGWKKNIKAWRYLAKQLKKTFRHDRTAWILEAWQPRKSWWPSYHFTEFHAKKDRAVLGMEKALVAGMLQGPACVYYTHVCGSGRREKKAKINRIKKFIKKHNCENIPKPVSLPQEPDVGEAATDS